MSRQTKPHACTTDLIVQTADQETVIYDSATNKAYVLNPTAAAVWHAANGQRSISDIAAHLSENTPTTEQTVWYALGQLNELLEEPVTLPSELVGVSRRKFLKMSGAVAAGVAIPMVVKMVAPSAASAQSLTGILCCSYSCPNGQEFRCLTVGGSCPPRADCKSGSFPVPNCGDCGFA